MPSFYILSRNKYVAVHKVMLSYLAVSAYKKHSHTENIRRRNYCDCLTDHPGNSKVYF